MAYNYNENYFLVVKPNIKNNKNIRTPQIEAYYKIMEYYSNEYKNRNSLIVLPTGVGKTGVMAMAPFGLAKKRVLIITPATSIRDTVLEAISPDNPENFWYKCKVITPGFILPNVIEYEGSSTPIEVLNSANIVVLNIHKLQERLNSSLINRVGNDFFDLIIIDEAHHSTAMTWVECVNYFKEAKVLKLTGTPFRTDGEKITGELIYKYSLSRAMVHEYVKSLSNIKYVPDELKLTIDGDSKLYTVDEILELGLRDQDWVTRSIAYSKECSEKIVDESIKALEEKLENSTIPHKIIAIACSIKHAKDIAEIYESKGISTAIIHSNLSKYEKEKAFKDIENHRVKAVINVAMLGEGYDHKYLSIAAIFRPFRNELPYAQFIGRVLRKINEGSAKDNIAKIISHQHLYLDILWEKYKKEIQESEIIKNLKDYDEILDYTFDDNTPRSDRQEVEYGTVIESNKHSIMEETYLDTELINKSKAEDKVLKEKLRQLQEVLGVNEEQAKILLQQTQLNKTHLGRPDLLYKSKKRNLDEEIRENIVPKFIEKFDINPDLDDLKDCGLFIGKYWWIPNNIKGNKGKNTAMLAMYYSSYLKNAVGLPRNEWSDTDFDNAFRKLEMLNEVIDETLNMYYNERNN